MVASILLDGQMAYGSRTVTIGGVAFTINNIRISRPSTEVMDDDTVGGPQRRRETHGLSELTGELQLATSSTQRPVFGATWTMTVDAAYGAETWVISPGEYEEDNQPSNIRVATIKAKKVINSITLVGTTKG